MWDLRMMSDDPAHQSHPVAGISSYATKNGTNQRLQFDLDDEGGSLFVGGIDGRVRVYSTTTGDSIETIEHIDGQPANGVSFASAGSRRLLAVSTGARKFPTEEELDLDHIPLDANLLEQYASFLYLYELRR
jgi:WD40 repeat protein